MPKPTAGVVASPSPAATASNPPPAAGASRVEVLNAADAAFARGDLATASGLYERVLNTPPSGEAPDAAHTIDDFARLRDMVTLLADGREDDAHAQLQAFQDPATPLARLASQLWDQYGMVGQLRGACAQLQPQIASQAASALSALQTLGVSVDAQTLCSVPART